MAATHPSRDAAFDDAGRLYRLCADTMPFLVPSARAIAAQ
jgi:hypothetical protein